MGTIYLIRHGKAAFGEEDYDRLHPLGVQQARCIGEALVASGVQQPLVVSGEMRRHRETLRECMAAIGNVHEIEFRAEWNEFDHLQIIGAAWPGDLNQLRGKLAEQPDSNAAFQRLFSKAMLRWVSGTYDSDYSETWTMFRARVSEALAAVVVAVREGRDALVFTSGGPVAAVVQQVLDLSNGQTVRLNWEIVNASLTSLRVGQRDVRLTSFNVHQHLQRAKSSLVTYR